MAANAQRKKMYAEERTNAELRREALEGMLDTAGQAQLQGHLSAKRWPCAW